MVFLPIEIWGHIGSFLRKKDHHRLSLCNKRLFYTLPSYSQKNILTLHQENMYNTLLYTIENTNLRIIWLTALSKSKRSYPLALFIRNYSKGNKNRKVFIVCESVDLEKWITLLSSFLEEPFVKKENNIYVFCDKIILTSSYTCWRSILDKESYLFICLSELTYYYRGARTIVSGRSVSWISFKNPQKKIAKVSIIPPSSYPQRLILEPNLFLLIDRLMEQYDKITILGGIKTYTGHLKKHAKICGKYRIITKDEDQKVHDKVVVVYSGKYLIREHANLSGVILIRSWISSEPYGEKYMIHEGIYHALFSSNAISCVYWHLGDVGYNVIKAREYMYEKFSEQLIFLVSLRYHFSIASEIQEFSDRIGVIPNRELLNRIFLREGNILSSNLYEFLKEISTEKIREYPFVQSMLTKERERY